MTLKTGEMRSERHKNRIFFQTLSNIALRLKLVTSLKSISSNISLKKLQTRSQNSFPSLLDQEVSWRHVTKWSSENHEYSCIRNHSGFKFLLAIGIYKNFSKV